MPVKYYRLFQKCFFYLIVICFLPIASWSQIQLVTDTVRSCKTDSLQLSAEAGYDSYLWSNGDTTQSTWVSIMGNYLITTGIGDTLFYVDSVFVGIVDAEILEVSDTIF